MREGHSRESYSVMLSGSVHTCAYYDLSLCHCRANMVGLMTWCGLESQTYCVQLRFAPRWLYDGGEVDTSL